MNEITVLAKHIKKTVNKLGVTISAYRCRKCGYLNATPYFENKEKVRCFRCREEWEVKT